MKIGAGYWFRAAVMICGLIVVILLIRKMNQPHALDSSFFGNGATAATICPTRILWVETAQGSLHIEEEGSKWVRLMNGDQKTLDPIAVEKWVSQFCSIDTEPTDEQPDGLQQMLKIGYVSHKQTEFLTKSASGVYELRGQRFKSKALADLLTNLPMLPLETQPGAVRETPASH